MPALANIVVQDNVPANRTYIPTSRNGGVTQWEERSSAYALGYSVFTHTAKGPAKNRAAPGVYKHKLSLVVSTVSLADPARPVVAHFIPFNLDVNTSTLSSESDRASAYDQFRNLLNNSTVREAFIKNTGWFG